VFETLFILPLAFWVVMAILIAGAVHAVADIRKGTGIPTLMVLTTVTFWYVGDAMYNDYPNNHAKLFDSGVLQSAWWQVAWFLSVFLLVAPRVHRWFNARYLGRTSGVIQMFRYGVGQPAFQMQLELLFYVCMSIWLAVSVLAAIRVKGQILYYFFPFWGYKADPWGRGTLGSGFDSLVTVVFYFHMLVTGIFGVVAALATNRRVRFLAIAFCLVSWPYFIFDRTRNSLLAVVMPGILSWCLLGLRGSVLKKAAALAVCFLVVNVWMKFIISNRDNMTITAAIKEKGLNLQSNEKVHHEGLNMYEELCWINSFIEGGNYTPNWGARYFADLVNPVPRVIWPGKPTIGFDYAVLRGQEVGGDSVISATISTGLIGQGVVNFGRILGPAAAALIMSFWSAILARLDLTAERFGRLPLYATGLFVTFNVGRDFCFLALYPFVFGAIMVWFLERYHPQLGALPMRTRAAMPQSGTGQKPGRARRLFNAPPRVRRRIGFRRCAR
jgi:hypothetical protein